MAGSGSDIPPVPTRPEQAPAPRIGVDEWVATHEARRDLGRGLVGVVRRELERVPRPGFYLAFAVAAALLPVVTSNGYVIRVGFDTLLYMLLALGLNIVVGYAGLLDLGYVAFYGFGAYGYAMLASPKFGLHWSTLAVVPVVVVATAILGFLVALPSRRLLGDYLAIVTLFFGQLFVTVVQNGQAMSFLGFTRPYDVTGGPNGIPDIDPFNAFGGRISSLDGYYYAALAIFLAALAAVYLVDQSRTGRAWKSLREDALAAELMGMPVNRLKLVAFAFGAAIAGLTGTLFAALNTAVFAADFDVPTLIIVYAMLILGGAGSLGGVILGALIVNVSLEVLRTPGHATWVFYGLLAATLVVKVRPWRWLAAVVVGTAGLGFAAHAVAAAAWPRGVHGEPAVGGVLGSGLRHWVLLPTDPRTIGNVAFVCLVLAVLWVTTLRGWAQKLALVPTLYLAAFVWENRLIDEPSVTRLILVGVILIVLMNARPQGLVGSARVEIV
ncbi:MAG: branched-chain amino acid ABC transporter permease [Thermoleophilia bacterium]|nr:branched-chain amino acid ABC transporter permease [Thermoleophilia bacterium]